MTENERWEYLTCFLYASIENEGAKAYMREKWPGWEAKKYSPETMIPELNELGDEGWDLVHMQPIGAVGSKRDVGFVAGEITPRWSNSYFCVFKRPRR